MAMKTRSQSGFTILEILVSVTVIALMSIALSQIFISTLRTNTKTEYLKEVKQNGDLALESLVRMTQSAQSVTCISGREMDIINPDGNTTTVECALDGTILRLASTSASGTDYLTSGSVTLSGSDCAASSLSFTCIETTSSQTSVAMMFTLTRAGSAGNIFEQAQETFQTSAIVRSRVP